MTQNTKNLLIGLAVTAVGIPSLLYLVSLLPKVEKPETEVIEEAIPEPEPDAVRNNPFDNSVFQVEHYLERNLNDPDSYEGIEWSKVEKYRDPNDSTSHVFIVKHKYRAKNAFGGYVVDLKEFRLDSEGNVIQVD